MKFLYEINESENDIEITDKDVVVFTSVFSLSGDAKLTKNTDTSDKRKNKTNSERMGHEHEQPLLGLLYYSCSHCHKMRIVRSSSVTV